MMSSYKFDLTKKVTLCKKALEDYKKECEGMTLSKEDFFKKLSKLNLLRIDLETAKSRLNNLHKVGPITSTQLIINKK